MKLHKKYSNFTYKPFLLISIFLIIITIAVYWQVKDFDFVSFDDSDYVTQNVQVQQGLCINSLVWAFAPTQSDTPTYWHPLTWLSHMMDCQLFGINPRAHHLINLLFHTLNVQLLFLALHLMTGAPWKSGFVAALFAVHPINVDSVAWIAERKNILSTAFWMLTILAYIRYARKPDVIRYLTVFSTLALGLLAKPMLVTLPCVLLLLDFWPLGRIDLGQARLSFIKNQQNSGYSFQTASIARLIIEKLPFLALAIGTIILSLISLQSINELRDFVSIPLNLRIENAIVSYIAYLWKMIWPTHLAVLYPFPKFIPIWQSLSAAILLIAISGLIFAKARKFPWLLTGWFWYLGTLLPVLGLVQGGLWPALADRWAYVPFIGIFTIIAWGAPELIGKKPSRQAGIMLMATILLFILSTVTWFQTQHWRNSTTLFHHAIEVTNDNHVAHFNLGTALADSNKTDQAISHYLKSLTINPYQSKVCMSLGLTLIKQGNDEKALVYLQKSVLIDPENYHAQYNLGTYFLKKGNFDQAIFHLKKSILLDPNNDMAQFNLAKAFFNKKDYTSALKYISNTFTLNYEHEKAHKLAGVICFEQKNFKEALVHLYKVLSVNPSSAEAHQYSGIIFLKQKQIDKALASFKKALTLDPKNKEVHQTIRQIEAKLVIAEQNILRELEKNSDNPKLRKQLGKIYQVQNLNGSAIEQYELVLRQNPKSIDILYLLSSLHADQGQYKVSISYMEQSISLQPDNPTHYYNIACLYAIQEMTAPALSWLKKGLVKGYKDLNRIQTDEDLNSIRNTKEFKQLMKKIELAR